jgi:hypothetical protein
MQAQNRYSISAAHEATVCVCVHTHSVNSNGWPSHAVIMSRGMLLHVGINRREAGRQIAGAAPKTPGLGSFLFKTHLRLPAWRRHHSVNE